MSAQATLFEVPSGKMSIEDFGRALLETGDLDPIYTILVSAERLRYIHRPQLKRWLLAYWMFYHAGVATRLSEYEGGRFFDRCCYVVEGNKAPRGTERRHFRGQKAWDAIVWLSTEFQTPESAVDVVADCRTFLEVRERVMGWPQFGPWIAFKVADMLERVLQAPIDFSDCNLLGFYKEPRKAAELLSQTLGVGISQVNTPDDALSYALRYFRDQQAPPTKDRPVNVQEIETILCKWKSHCNGHYPVGKDTREIRHALDGYGELADKLKGLLPA